jgi:hypothetical protein
VEANLSLSVLNLTSSLLAHASAGTDPVGTNETHYALGQAYKAWLPADVPDLDWRGDYLLDEADHTSSQAQQSDGPPPEGGWGTSAGHCSNAATRRGLQLLSEAAECETSNLRQAIVHLETSVSKAEGTLRTQRARTAAAAAAAAAAAGVEEEEEDEAETVRLQVSVLLDTASTGLSTTHSVKAYIGMAKYA